MNRLLVWYGRLVDWYRGPRRVEVYRGPIYRETVTLKATTPVYHEKLILKSRRTVYQVHYERWWVKDCIRSVYTVVCEESPDLEHNYNPLLFVPQTFPNLANRHIADTERAHLYAIHAFLDQFIAFKSDCIEA